MKIFLFIVKRAPVLTCLAMLTALLSGLCSGGLVALIHRALEAETGEVASTSAGLLNQTPSGLFGLFLLAVVLTLLSAIAANLVITYLYRQILLDLQIRLARAITRTPLAKLEQIGSPSLLVMLTEDIDNISDTATELVPLISNVVTVMVCFGYLIWLSWQAFVATLVFLIIGGGSYQLMMRREQKILTISREKLDILYRYFNDLTVGTKELKLNEKQANAFLNQVLSPTAHTVQKLLFRWDMAYAIISAWGRFLILMVVGLILFLLPRYFSLSSSILSGYILALLYVRSSLLAIIDTLPELAEAAVALEKVESVGLDLAYETAIAPAAPSATPVTPWHSLQLVAVTHRYYREREDGVFTLGPITLEFQPGELVFLIGGNGSGKSTLAKLITGLYPPESGELRLDGRLVGHPPAGDTASREKYLKKYLSPNQYRQIFSMVFTDFHLFDELLGLALKENKEEQIAHYLARLQLDHKINIQDGKVSTTALSRGQQQRLALLVAYLEDRSFYVFDEWASNQDPIFKAVFYTELLPELREKGKTVLVISHDDHYFHLGDRILKLTDGQLTAAKITDGQLT
ncbi:MAG: cyclic peptide export ABC transporter [Phormidesmis sp.]